MKVVAADQEGALSAASKPSKAKLGSLPAFVRKAAQASLTLVVCFACTKMNRSSLFSLAAPYMHFVCLSLASALVSYHIALCRCLLLIWP